MTMSAECGTHGVDLLGYMDEAYCPVCKIECLEADLAEAKQALEQQRLTAGMMIRAGEDMLKAELTEARREREYLKQGLESMRDKLGGPDCDCRRYAGRLLKTFVGLASVEATKGYRGLAGEEIIRKERDALTAALRQAEEALVSYKRAQQAEDDRRHLDLPSGSQCICDLCNALAAIREVLPS